MVKAELSYNPYLLETRVSFNGNPPRINSLVEKYCDGKLQEWIDEVPRVFYDEMNGYDFELVFSGTDLDFKELERAFARAGVGKDRVRLTHERRLGSRSEKVREIFHLLAWLSESPNRRFDWTGFRSENREIFEAACPFVVIGNLASNMLVKNGELFENIATSIDMVESIGELNKTDLSSTPILVIVDRQTVAALPRNVQGLLGRSDIKQNQLFFLIHHEPEKVERVIKDLGIIEPQIVSFPNDGRIAKFLEIYPVSERIKDSIEKFGEQIEIIGKILEDENRLNEAANRDVHEKIKEFDGTLGKLKEASSLFTSRGHIGFPTEFSDAKESLMAEIDHWRAKKTKIGKPEDAEPLSQEFEETAVRHFKRFQEKVSQIFHSRLSEIESSAARWYKIAECDLDFIAETPMENPSFKRSIPSIAPRLMAVKSERYITPKEDFFESVGKFFSGAANVAPQEPILETVFSCEEWRNHVAGIVDPIADAVIQEAYLALEKHLDQLSRIYLDHIDTLIQDASDKKAQALAQLSEDERLLQADNDWHSEFNDRLHAIGGF